MSEDLADLRDVALLAGRAADVDHTLGTALEALAEVIPYDLAAVLELRDGSLRVRCARGPLADARVRQHVIDLAQAPALAAAINSGRPRVYTEEDHDHARGGDGDPYQGIVELPHGHSCMVAPLIAAGRTVGIMTFDRAICERYDDGTVALVTVYAQLVALALALALGPEEAPALRSLRGPTFAGK
jgi:transcriptional regulator with GAF, ATPase, and Fis domain